MQIDTAGHGSSQGNASHTVAHDARTHTVIIIVVDVVPLSLPLYLSLSILLVLSVTFYWHRYFRNFINMFRCVRAVFFCLPWQKPKSRQRIKSTQCIWKCSSCVPYGRVRTYDVRTENGMVFDPSDVSIHQYNFIRDDRPSVCSVRFVIVSRTNCGFNGPFDDIMLVNRN